MGLSSALVDKMRWIRNEPAGERVDGETPMKEVSGPWLRCRMSEPTFAQKRSDSSYDYVRDATVITAIRFVNGQAFDVKAGDRVEVKSDVFGDLVYELVAPPEPVRAARRIVLYRMGLRKHTYSGNQGDVV